MSKNIKEIKNTNLSSVSENYKQKDECKPKRKRKRKHVTVVAKIGGVYYIEEIAEDVRIPFLYRGLRKCAEKIMVEKTLIAKYYPLFGDEVFDCINAKAVRVDRSEINLLNEINIVYGKCEYLNRSYTTNEVLLDVTEVREMAKFLEVCYNMMVIMRDDIEQCGYIKVDDSDALIPFVNVGNEKLIPLFFFEGCPLNLDDVKINLTASWPLAYIKILCKMQNVRKDLYNFCTSLEVIKYVDLMKMIRDGAPVETCWPDSFECNLLRKIPSHKFSTVKLNKEFNLHVTLIDDGDEEFEANCQMITVEDSDTDTDSDEKNAPKKVTISGDTPTVVCKKRS